MGKLVYQWSKLEIDETGISRRKKFRNQIVLPECFKKLVYEELHAKMGHLGAEKVFELIQSRIYLPNMWKEFNYSVTKVCRCLKDRKPNREHRAPLVNIHATESLEVNMGMSKF